MKAYLDNAATTRISDEVLQSMKAYLMQAFGNASSVYSSGRISKQAIEAARKRIAQSINAQPEEIYFTSGGSESDNTAIKGIVSAGNKKQIITSVIEHPAVLQTCSYLEKFGYTIVRVPVNQEGIVDPADVEKSITSDTALISIMTANNEIGTIQPVEEIGRIAFRNGIPFHTDAVQAIGAVPVDVQEMGVDMLSLSGHKIHAPKGIGALYIRYGLKIDPLIHGGGQEHGMRSGTENVAGIVALGTAVEISNVNLQANTEHKERLRNTLLQGIRELNVPFRINGSLENRLSGNLNVSFPESKTRNLVMYMDYKGIACSSGSACSANSQKSSYVLKAIGCSEKEAVNSLRFSVGDDTTEDEIQYTLDILKQALTGE